MKNILDMKLGSRIQRGVVRDIQQEDTTDKDGVLLPKIILRVDVPEKKTLRIDEAWVRDRHDQLVAHGLWLKFDADKNINSLSTLGKLMDFYSLVTLRDLMGREIMLYPKKNEFLAVVATKDFDEDNI